jgi:hypothetical protein
MGAESHNRIGCMVRVLPSKEETAGVTTVPVATNPFAGENPNLWVIDPRPALDPNRCSNSKAFSVFAV